MFVIDNDGGKAISSKKNDDEIVVSRNWKAYTHAISLDFIIIVFPMLLFFTVRPFKLLTRQSPLLMFFNDHQKMITGSIRMGVSWCSFVVAVVVAYSFCDCQKVETCKSYNFPFQTKYVVVRVSTYADWSFYDSRSSSGLQREQSLSFRASLSSYRVALVYNTTWF